MQYKKTFFKKCDISEADYKRYCKFTGLVKEFDRNLRLNNPDEMKRIDAELDKLIPDLNRGVFIKLQLENIMLTDELISTREDYNNLLDAYHDRNIKKNQNPKPRIDYNPNETLVSGDYFTEMNKNNEATTRKDETEWVADRYEVK